MNQLKAISIHSDFQLNGIPYDGEGLKKQAAHFIQKGAPFEKELGIFILDWLNTDSTIILQTSGTTAVPKKLSFQKQALVNSALTTGAYFKLIPGQRALHCLPAKYIAGKMMLVRALVLGLHLDVVVPSSTPLKDNSRLYDFVAMTPFQATHSLEDMDKVSSLIVGGSTVDPPLKKALIGQKIQAFETYGMTETLSHIAVRKMDAPTAEFNVLPDISVRQDKRNCLVVDAPNIGVANLVTNDEIELIDDKTFRLIGRIDHVINSGGIKLHPEVIESKLSEYLAVPFFIGSLPDPVLGEDLVMAVVTSPSNLNAIIIALDSASLGAYERPKTVLFYDFFHKTPTGKIKRKDTLAHPYLDRSNLE